MSNTILNLLPTHSEELIQSHPRTTEYIVKHTPTDGDLVMCSRCKSVVLLSDLEEYKFQCFEHDEDLMGFECEPLDHAVTDNEKETLFIRVSDFLEEG